MDLNDNVISAMVQEGVSAEQLRAFATQFDIQDDPFVIDVLHHLLFRGTEISSDTSNQWTMEDDDRLLEMIQSQELPVVTESSTVQVETQSPDFEKLPVNCSESTHAESDDDFEPWSVEFQSAVMEYQESASTSIARDQKGQTKTGKHFYCSRCRSNFPSYELYSLHRATHRSSEESMEPGPSGLQQSSQPQTIPFNGQVGCGDEPYRIELSGTRKFARSSASETTYKVKFNDQWQGRPLTQIRRELHRMFEDLLSRARVGLNGNDLLRVVLQHQALNHAVVVPLMPAGHMSVERILNKVESVLQSEENLSVDTSFQVMVGALHIPQGAGRRIMTQISGQDNSIHKKSSMVQIVNEDQLCLARALGVCLAKKCLVTDEEWRLTKQRHHLMTNPKIMLQERQISLTGYRHITDKNRKEQKQLAALLCEKAGIPVDRPGSLNDLPSFEEALQIRIAVVAASLGNQFIRVPSNDHQGWPILYLYLMDHEGMSHFHGITNITGFFSAHYFCERCFKQYSNNTKHRCESTCLTCKSQNCPETDNTLSCRSCHMVCRSLDCFERHLAMKTRKQGDKEVTLSQCEQFWRCVKCKKVINRFKRPVKLHRCAEWFCKCCRSWVAGNHQCYLFPEEPKKPVDKFIFFDFEATQDTIAQCQEGYDPMKCCKIPCDQCDKCKRCFKSWCGQPRHVPNFVVAQTVCQGCQDHPLTPGSTCDRCGSRCVQCHAWDHETKTYVKPPCVGTCGLREVIFQGDTTLDDFGNWLFNAQHKDATVMAHNMKGYDGVFLMEYLLNNGMQPSKVIYNGSKIMYMEVAKGLNIRIIDSLNFLPMKLAALPRAFGLAELKKGFFPHFYNKRENQRYVGPYPDPSTYGADYMETKDRIPFLEWHEEKTESGAIFDFRKEIEEYCRSDVDILRRACVAFRQLMLTATEIDPFRYITIASVCMGIFKTRFLEAEYQANLEYPVGIIGPSVASVKKTPVGWLTYNKRTDNWEPLQKDVTIKRKTATRSDIAQVPSAGYIQRDTYSKASIQWLEYLMELARQKGETLRIQHALNGGEATILGTSYKVDGREGNTVYEFHGCLWHGCPKCYPERDVKNPKTGQTMSQVYALTLEKRRVLTQEYRFLYVCVWEHEWSETVRKDIDAREFVTGLDIQDRLDPRDSFFGGRTNAAKLHYKVEGDEKIKYVDFTSLYPYVNKYGRYPIGHPEIITSDFQDIGSYFGIAKVKILAPRGLYHPVLPYRCNGKLKFPLCRSCADSENRTTCQHTDEQRAFLGTWCTPEIQKAIEKGYVVLQIYEVYHWEESTQYDRQEKRGGLFEAYVNTFLKFKQEASGWPDWVVSQDQKKKYIRDYFDNEGIRLDPAFIEKNPGLRALAKLCLNSFWGKFGQRLNQGVCEFIHSSQMDKFYRLLTDRTKKVKDFHIINENHLHLEYEHQSDFVPEDMKTNVFLATFTTCFARLRLYGVLDRLDERVLYYDTDSVLYVSRPGLYEPPLGDYLGELTDELEHEDHIVEFVSGGPKNYAYTTFKGKRACKIRGFTLNHTNDQLLNFDSVKDVVKNVEPSQPATYTKAKLKDGDQIVQRLNGTTKTCIVTKLDKKRPLEDKVEPPSKIILINNSSKISRDKYDNILYNKEENKRYRVVYDKRVIGPELDTLPFGY